MTEPDFKPNGIRHRESNTPWFHKVNRMAKL